MSEPRVLTPDQHRAADMIGRNFTLAMVADELKVSERTLSRWNNELPEFESAVQEARDKVLDGNPTARSVLEDGLHATKKNGEIDWTTRVACARLLLTGSNAGGPDPGDERPQTFIFVDPNAD